MYYSFKNFETSQQMLANQIVRTGNKYDYIYGVLCEEMFPGIGLSYKLNIPVLPIYWSFHDFKNRYMYPDTQKIF